MPPQQNYFWRWAWRVYPIASSRRCTRTGKQRWAHHQCCPCYCRQPATAEKAGIFQASKADWVRNLHLVYETYGKPLSTMADGRLRQRLRRSLSIMLLGSVSIAYRAYDSTSPAQCSACQRPLHSSAKGPRNDGSFNHTFIASTLRLNAFLPGSRTSAASQHAMTNWQRPSSLQFATQQPLHGGSIESGA